MKEHTRWTLFYRFLRAGVFITSKFFFKKSAISKTSNWPDKRPIIWAPNHQNAFLDGIILSLLTKENPHQIVRGSVFGNKYLDLVLSAAHLLPIYRKSDGAEAIRKNDSTMQRCYDLLNVNESIVIYPEGRFAPKKKLFPLQKGVIRMAFGTALQYGFDCGLVVWPLGINYGDPNKYRTTVYYNLGEAIEIKDYEEAYKEDPKNAERALLEEISKRMSAVMINIQDDNIYKEVEFLRDIYSYQSGADPNLKTHYDRGKKLTDKIQAAHSKSPDNTAKLLSNASKYQELLMKMNMKDWVVQNENYNPALLLIRLVGLLILSPLFIISLVLNSPPYHLAKRIADEKIKEFQFKSSVRFAAGDFAFLFWYIFIGILGFIFLPIAFAFLLIPIALLVFYFSGHYFRPQWKRLMACFRFNFNRNKADYKEAILLKLDIYNEIKILLDK